MQVKSRLNELNGFWTYRGALLPGVEDVVFPDGDAVCGEPDPLEAVPHQLVWYDPQRPTLPGRLRQVLPHVHAEVLKQSISELFWPNTKQKDEDRNDRLKPIRGFHWVFLNQLTETSGW